MSDIDWDQMIGMNITVWYKFMDRQEVLGGTVIDGRGIYIRLDAGGMIRVIRKSDIVSIFGVDTGYSSLPKLKEEDIMLKAITDVYEKTADAILVDKHFKNEIPNNFIGRLVTDNFKQLILEEAQRREKEEKETLIATERDLEFK